MDILLKDILNQLGNFEAGKMNLLTQWCVSVCYHFDYLNTNMSCECLLVDSAFYIDIPQFIVIVKVTYTWYKCDCAQKLTGTPPHVVIIADR